MTDEPKKGSNLGNKCWRRELTLHITKKVECFLGPKRGFQGLICFYFRANEDELKLQSLDKQNKGKREAVDIIS